MEDRGPVTEGDIPNYHDWLGRLFTVGDTVTYPRSIYSHSIEMAAGVVTRIWLSGSGVRVSLMPLLRTSKGQHFSAGRHTQVKVAHSRSTAMANERQVTIDPVNIVKV